MSEKFIVLYEDNSTKTLWGFFGSEQEAERFARNAAILLNYPHQYFDVQAARD